MSRAWSFCGSWALFGFLVVGCAGAPATKAPPAPPRIPEPGLPAVVAKRIAGADEGPAASAPSDSTLATSTSTSVAKGETAAPPATAGGDRRPPLEMTTVSERDWIASVRKKVAEKLAVEPGELRLSPSKSRLAVVRDPNAAKAAAAAEARADAEAKAKASGKKVRATRPYKAPPRRFQIIVADTEGKVEGRFRTLTWPGSDEPPRDFRFLGEDRLIYEVVKPAPASSPGNPRARSDRRRMAKVSKGKGEGANDTAPDPEKRLIVIQPLGRRPRPIRCEHIYVAWNQQHTHIASMGGPPNGRFVAVDGEKVYPRRGSSRLSGPPAWSKDGTSLAFVETRPAKPARLVLLAEFDNPTGDTFWDLPAGASMEGAQAYFTGHDRLVVGKSALKPLFAAPFTKEKSTSFDP